MKGVIIGIVLAVLIIGAGFYFLAKKSAEYGEKVSAERTAAAKAQY
ncbi:MAG: hypothetical protein HYZ83_03370 [Candidatus Omnitrophica bacterium]|nr:hypothetical protein [Candidatus Omnitrophota bacterium]